MLPQGTVITYTSNATLIYPDANLKGNTWFMVVLRQYH